MTSYELELAGRQSTLAALLADVRSGDTALRLRAVDQAALVGVSAIVPLGDVCGGSDPAAAKAALEALRRVALHAGRPGANAERRKAGGELVKLLAPARPRRVRAEALYLLGHVGLDAHVAPMARLLKDETLAADARMALTRMPGKAARRALAAAG
ncbi:MAG: hypothetical protein NT029_15960 [Armatimonadetes bacterium]|nr:hypothetical protein [Armatimonadota bacterium]